MAKKALVVKANRKPKFKVRGYTRCQRCGRPRAVYRVFGLCRICVREMAHARRAARRHQELLVTPHAALAPPRTPRRPQIPTPTGPARETAARKDTGNHDDDRPDRRHAHASAQRQLGVPRHRGHAVLEDQDAHRRDPPAGGLHRRLVRRGRRRRVRARRSSSTLKYGPNRERSIAGHPRGSPSPACGSTPRRPTCPGARRPRRRDHLDVGRPADRPAGRQAQVGGEVLAYVW